MIILITEFILIQNQLTMKFIIMILSLTTEKEQNLEKLKVMTMDLVIDGTIKTMKKAIIGLTSEIKKSIC